MKLYHFNPNTYGREWFVMSDSEENAIKTLNQHLLDDFNKNPFNNESNGDKPLQWDDDYFKPRYDNKGYTIDVYDANQIIESEIA